MLLGFPTGIPEAGQRWAEPHPAASGALDGFLQLLEEEEEVEGQNRRRDNAQAGHSKETAFIQVEIHLITEDNIQ